MSNAFYNASGNPIQSGPLDSAVARSEYSAIGAGFDKFPNLSGNANRVWTVDPSGTYVQAGITVTPNADATLTIAATKTLTVNQTTTVNANSIALSGMTLTMTTANNLTFTTTGATNVTLPTSGTLQNASGSVAYATLAGDVAGAATYAYNVVGGAQGSIPYQIAGPLTAMLAIGTAGQILQSTGTVPAWVDGQSVSLTQFMAVQLFGGM